MIPLLLVGCAPAAPAPWSPGELYIEQIGLEGGIGEAALVVGPDGTRALIDVGNDSHAEALRDAVERATGSAAVDWVVLTHFHADHVGGMDELAVSVASGVISRGPYDVGPDANLAEWAGVVELRAEGAYAFYDLCEGPPPDPGGATFPATSCAALAVEAPPAVIPLGEGAELRVLVADGFTAAATFGAIGDDENARSLGGTVRWGDFVYWWGGDLTGGGKGTPDLEGWLADTLPAEALPPVDAAHLHHHGISSSTGAAWAARLFPDPARDAAAIVGATGAYLDAPSEEALAAVGPRLGGGKVWATEDGWTAGADPALRVAHGSIVVRVREGGGGHRIEGGGLVEVRED